MQPNSHWNPKRDSAMPSKDSIKVYNIIQCNHNNNMCFLMLRDCIKVQIK